MTNTPHQPPVRETATVSVSAPVDGTKQRRTRALERRTRTHTTYQLQVDPQVMATARRALQPGQRLVIVSATEVRLVNAS